MIARSDARDLSASGAAARCTTHSGDGRCVCAEAAIGVIAVDSACTGVRGARHRQAPLTGKTRMTGRHAAASVAIGRGALGHRIKRRTALPRAHQSDVHGHRTAQARPGGGGSEGNRPCAPDHGPRTPDPGPQAPDPCAPDVERTRWTRTPKTVRGVRLRTGSGNRTHSRSVSRNGSPSGRSPPRGSLRLRTVAAARRVNREMPAHVARRVTALRDEAGCAVQGTEVPLLGMTCKPDVADLRQSPASAVARCLTALGATVRFHDPHHPIGRHQRSCPWGDSQARSTGEAG